MEWRPPALCVLVLALTWGLQVNAIRVRRSNHLDNVCSMWGNFHFKTFDGDVYQFQGICEYNLVSHCHGSVQDFSVHVKRSEFTGDSKINSVLVTIGDMAIELTKDLVMVNGDVVKLPHYVASVLLEQHAPYIKLYAKLGLSVMWNKDDAVMVELETKYTNNTCGLCGDFNGMAILTEFISEAREIGPIEFGNKHRIHNPNSHCKDLYEEDKPSTPRKCQEFRPGCSELLEDTAWKSCTSIVSPEPYIQACVVDRCWSRPGKIEDSLSLCTTLSEYSRQCSHAGGTPPNWRKPDFCAMKCPYNMEYSESGSPCVDTCSHTDTSLLCEEHKMDGCFCPRGTVFDDISDRGCIPQEQCQCKHNKVYNSGDVLHMVDKECVCHHGSWTCESLPTPGLCAVEEGSHFTTFDGKEFTFHGECYYILSQDCEESKFTVLGQLIPCVDHETDTCLKSVVLLPNNDTNNVLVIKDDGTVRQNGDLTLPYSSANLIVFRPSSFHIIVQTSFGLRMQVQLVPVMQLYITLDRSYQTKTCGLCGNFNMVLSDELKTPQGLVEGTASSFANSWKAQSNCRDRSERLDDPCSYNIDSEHYAEHWCSKLLEKEGQFAKCHSSVNPESYYKRCKYSTCTCEKTENCLCGVFSSYVRACTAKGIFLQGWRDTVCKKDTENCPATQTFSYMLQGCQRTCDSLSLERPACINTYLPVDGCACPDGLYENEKGVCVALDKCSCYHNGERIKPGKSITIKNEHCVCTKGKLHCHSWKPSVTDCPAPKVFFNCSEAGPDEHGLECAQTCAQKTVDCFLTGCTSGCQCPSGLLDDGRDQCVPQNNCPCKHNGYYYSPGSQITDQCNTCTCKQGKWKCTENKCPGTCTIYGSGHYNTFDKRRFGFSGDCGYIAAQNKCGNKTGTFHVITENVPCGTTGTTCSKSVRIVLGKTQLDLIDGKVTNTDLESGILIKYRVRNVGLYLAIEADIGLTVLWDRKTTVRIILQPQHMGEVCGLCGNFNGNGKDDFTTQGQLQVSDVLEFANSWKVNSHCPDAVPDFDPCSKAQNRHTWAKMQCSIITGETFKECHSMVDPAPYFDNCVRDSCACDTGGDCECFCTAVAAYAQACNEAGVCVAWRTPEICPVFCEYYNDPLECLWHYSPCHTPCYKTCLNPDGICRNPLPNLEGCYPTCPEDKPIFDEEKQICVEKCEGCFINGTEYETGEEIPSDKLCTLCFCDEHGRANCSPREGCCFYNGTEYGDNDVIYYVTDNMGMCYYAICINSTVIETSEPCQTTPSTTTEPTTTFTASTTEVSTTVVTSTTTITTPTPTSTTQTLPTPTVSQETTPCVKCDWTEWFNVYDPVTGEENDLETYKNIRDAGKAICDTPEDIECKAVSSPNIPLDEFVRQTGQVVQCNVSFGLVCKKDDQENSPYKCLDYTIRALCCRPCESTPSPTTTITTPKETTTSQTTPHPEPTPSSTTTTTPVIEQTTTPGTTTKATTTPEVITESTTPHPEPTPSSITTTTPEIEQTTTPGTTTKATTTPEVITEPTTTLTTSTTEVSTTEVTLTTTITTTTPTVSHEITPCVKCDWTEWFNVYDPVTGEENDLETYENIRDAGKAICKTPEDIECKAVSDPDISLDEFVRQTGQVVQCNVSFGLVCKKDDQENSPYKCLDYTIRALCCRPCESTPSPTTTITTPKETTTSQTTPHPESTPSSTTPEVITEPTTTLTTSTTEVSTTEVTLTTTITTTTPTVSHEITPCVKCDWTEWFNVYDPVTGEENDLETYKNIRDAGKAICKTPEDIECKAVSDPDISLDEFVRQTGQVVQCNVSFGLVCKKDDQENSPYKCLDYTIRALCCRPCESTPSPTTTITTPKETTTSQTTPHPESTPSSTTTTTPVIEQTTTPGTTTKATTTPEVITESTTPHPEPTPSSITTTTPEIEQTTTPGTTTKATTTPEVITESTTPHPEPTPSSITTTTPEIEQTTTPGTTTKATTTPEVITEPTTTLTTSTTEVSTAEVTLTTTITTTTPTVSHEITPCVKCDWTEWFNVYDPVTGEENDLETYENIRDAGKAICKTPEDIECKAVSDPDISLDEFVRQTGQVVQCNVSFGLVCKKDDQENSPYKCLDYTIRALCCRPCESTPSPTTTITTPKETTTSQTTPHPESTPSSTTPEVITEPTTTLTTSTTEVSTTEVTLTTTITTTTPTVSHEITPCVKCDWTEWFNVYDPVTGEENDLETYKNIRDAGKAICKTPEDIECKAVSDPDISLDEFVRQTGQVVQCNVSFGLVCKKDDQENSPYKCLDYTIRALCCRPCESTPSPTTTITTPKETTTSQTTPHPESTPSSTTTTTPVIEQTTTPGTTTKATTTPEVITESTTPHPEPTPSSITTTTPEIEQTTTPGTTTKATTTPEVITESTTPHPEPTPSSITTTTPEIEQTTTPGTTTKATTTPEVITEPTTTLTTSTTEVSTAEVTLTTTITTTTPTVSHEITPCVKCDWTEWFNVYDPVTGEENDLETYENIRDAGKAICKTPEDIECKAVSDPDISLDEFVRQTGQVVQCNVSFGLVCKKDDQENSPYKCLDYTIRALCCRPCESTPSPTTTITTPKETTTSQTTPHPESTPSSTTTTTPVIEQTTTPGTTTKATTTPEVITESTTPHPEPTPSSITTTTPEIEQTTTPGTTTKATTTPEVITEPTTPHPEPTPSSITTTTPEIEQTTTPGTTTKATTTPEVITEPTTTLTTSTTEVSTTEVTLTTTITTTTPTVSHEITPCVKCDWTEWFNVYDPVTGEENDLETYKNIRDAGKAICKTPEDIECKAVSDPDISLDEFVRQTGQVVQCNVSFGLVCKKDDQENSPYKCLDYTIRALCCRPCESTPSPTTTITTPKETTTSQTTPHPESTPSSTTTTTPVIEQTTTPGTTTKATTTPEVITESTTPHPEPTPSSITTTTPEIEQTTTPGTTTKATTTPEVITESTTPHPEPTPSSITTTTPEIEQTTTPGTTTKATTTPEVITESTTPHPEPTPTYTPTTTTTTPEIEQTTTTVTTTKATTTPEVILPTTKPNPLTAKVITHSFWTEQQVKITTEQTSTTVTTTEATTTPKVITKPTTPHPGNEGTTPTSTPTTGTSTTARVPSTTVCVCVINGVHYEKGKNIFNMVHIGSGICLTMICSDVCEIKNKTVPCPTTKSPPSTTPKYDCPTWKVNKNETFKIQNCTMARCIKDTIIEIMPYQCPPLKNITCPNKKKPVLVWDENNCCKIHDCDCICEGWGDPHYVTFDGLFYSHQGNCTYVLMEETRPKHNLKIYIDNVKCDPRLFVSCPRALIVSYNGVVITLRNNNLIGAAKLEALLGHTSLKLPFDENGLRVLGTGVNMIVEIPQLQVVLKFGVTGFSVNLPFRHFGGNTQGHCGTCNNNTNDDCMLPGGKLIDDCAVMADYWLVKDLYNPDCPQPPAVPPTSTPISTPTKKPGPDNPVCGLLKTNLFKECHPYVSPDNFFTGCQFDSSHVTNPAVVCTSLQTYASACSQFGVCLHWRNHTNLCNVSCEGNKVYKPCGPAEPPTCQDKPNGQSMNVTTEGCFCPDGTMLFNKDSGVCVDKCGCLDPSGQARELGEKFEHNCQDCVCEAATASVTCQPKQCSNSKPVICNEPGFIVANETDPTDECCTIFTCRCDSSLCPSLDGKCNIGYAPVLTVPEGKCCPELRCEPKKVCVHKNIEYEPGTNPVVDCQECNCTWEVDPKSKLYKIRCGMVTCNKDCEPGFEYIEPLGEECCGKCVQTNCVINHNGTRHVLQVGAEWVPRKPGCDRFMCANIGGEFIPTNYKIQCPPFNIDDCQPGTVQLSADGCCQDCETKDCNVQKNNTFLVSNGCTSVHPVNITSCAGSCETSSIYSMVANSMMHKCSCCQEMRTSIKHVQMNCPDGNQITSTYTYVEKCGCHVTECNDHKSIG